jgi:hypothetical protein
MDVVAARRRHYLPGVGGGVRATGERRIESVVAERTEFVWVSASPSEREMK